MLLAAASRSPRLVLRMHSFWPKREPRNMVVPATIETAASIVPGDSRNIERTPDSGSDSFTDALASATGATHAASSDKGSAAEPRVATSAQQAAKATYQPATSAPAVFHPGSAGSSSQSAIPTQFSKSVSQASSIAAPRPSAGNTTSGIPAVPVASEAPVPSTAIFVPVPVAIPPAPDPSPVAGTPAVVHLGATAAATPAIDAAGPNATQNTQTGAGTTAAPATDTETDTDTESASDEPMNVSALTETQNPQQLAATSNAPSIDADQSPILPAILDVAVAQPGDTSKQSISTNPQISAKPAAQAPRGPATQSSVTAENVVSTQIAPEVPSTLADASVISTATSPLAAQKHSFVTEALHAVSSSVASAVQSPFTAAATELPKSAAAVTTIAPSASTAAPSANAQTASGGGPGGGANGQSSSSRGNTQSGGSSSPDAFSVNTSGSTPAPVQPANDAAATSAMKADAAAAQSSQPNSSISTSLGEKSSTSSEPTSPLQNAASSDSATASDTALPGADISQAHLLGASGAAEMRISVNTETLGPIELRATSEKDRIGAVIAAAKPETQELLNSELPTLHQALSERNLQVQQLTVSQGSLAGGMSGRGGYSQSPDAWQKQAAGNYWQPPSEATVSSTEDLPAAVVSMAVPGKLSVHA